MMADTGGMSIVAERSEGGWAAVVCYDGVPIDGAKGMPDFALELSSSDGAAQMRVEGRLYERYERRGNAHVFSLRIPAPSLIAHVELETRYEVLNRHVVKKGVSVLQRNAPQIGYCLSTWLRAARPVDRKWAFDEFDAGEDIDYAYQRFPALGFAHGDLHVGMISENGYENKYPRNRRKRKVAPGFNYDAFEPIANEPDPDFMRFMQDGRAAFTIGAYRDARGETRHYNRLALGIPQRKAFYLFARQAAGIRDLKLAVQESYAEGRGFQGSQPQKVLFADAMINITIAEIGDETPHSVPAPIGYAPDMYNRDTFWTINALDDKHLNEALCKRFWDTQDETGCIGTIITPVTGSVEVKDNDSTILMFLWHCRNRRRFGSGNIPREKLDMAYAYCRAALDRDGDGRCTAHFPLSQQDISHYEDGMQLSVNQGMYALFLRAAKELGYPVEDGYLALAEAHYRAYYDEAAACLRLFDGDEITNSLDNLVPEFLSLWLFDHGMLTDEQVTRMVMRYPISKVKGARPLFTKRDGDALTIEEWPFKKNEYNRPGTYYNGGSWLRGEVMAYAAAYRHGLMEARAMIEDRLQAELDRYPDDPVSHEFLPTDPDYPYDDWIRNNSVFSWNVFALEAARMVGLRA